MWCLSFGIILVILAPKVAQSVALEEHGHIVHEFVAALKFFGEKVPYSLMEPYSKKGLNEI